MPRTGRPPEPVPDDIADALCDWLALGKPLRAFCRLPGMPARSTIDSWRQVDADFAGRVARARDIGHDAIADDCTAIADGEDNPDEDVHRSRLRVDTRLKLLACWDPRRYGNKAQVEHSGQISLDQIIGKTIGAEPSGAE